MADLQNTLGGLPVHNFSAGQQVDVSKGEKFKMGGEYISQLNVSRGGEHTHACMPGCVIQCSNIYADANGKEVVSPVEYETLGLLGTNCGLSDPDDLAQMNYIANDLGVDTIETGAMIAVLMEAGLGAFGDVRFMADCLAEIQRGTPNGRIWAQGTARVGEHYQRQAGAGHQEAGDQRLRSARGRGHRHHHDGHRPGRRSHRGQPAAAQDPRDGDPRDRGAERGPPGAGGGQRLARPLHLRHERDQSATPSGSPTPSTRPTAPASPRTSSRPSAARP